HQQRKILEAGRDNCTRRRKDQRRHPTSARYRLPDHEDDDRRYGRVKIPADACDPWKRLDVIADGWRGHVSALSAGRTPGTARGSVWHSDRTPPSRVPPNGVAAADRS